MLCKNYYYKNQIQILKEVMEDCNTLNHTESKNSQNIKPSEYLLATYSTSLQCSGFCIRYLCRNKSATCFELYPG